MLIIENKKDKKKVNSVSKRFWNGFTNTQQFLQRNDEKSINVPILSQGCGLQMSLFCFYAAKLC